jgi:hypothetical protein
MKKFILALFLVALLIPLPAKARLGETANELANRYGEPIKVADEFEPVYIFPKSDSIAKVGVEILPKALVWRVNNINIVAYLDKNNVCQFIHYVFYNQDFNYCSLETTAEVNKIIYDLLEKNSNGYKWSLHQTPLDQKIEDLSCYGRYEWKRSDGGYASFYRSDSPSVINELQLYKGDLIGLYEKLEMEKHEEDNQRKIEIMNSTNDL